MFAIKENSSDYIKKRRDLIKIKFKNSFCEDNILKISSKDIKYLFNLYDEAFFNLDLSNNLKGNIKFSSSNRMTKSAGKTIYFAKGTLKNFEIRISNIILIDYLNEIQNNEKKVCGLIVEDFFHAFMLILEHEICHVIEFYNYGSSNCKNKRFKTIANMLFGHKSSYHELLKSHSISKSTEEFKIGQVISFTYKGIEKTGIIANVTKRATIMVRDKNGIYLDSEKNRYSKWYVPLTLIKK